MKLTAFGVNSVKSPHDSTVYLGPYDLRVGCYTNSVSFTDSPTFVPSLPVWVGGSTYALYNFAQPTSNRAWCYILRNEIRTSIGGEWTDAAKILASSAST